jgi:hypothetical protein
VDRGLGGGGLGQHLGGGVHASDARPGPARLDEPGDIAGARAQVVHLAGLREIDAAQEIDGGTETVVGELQILRGIPGHG